MMASAAARPSRVALLKSSPSITATLAAGNDNVNETVDFLDFPTTTSVHFK
jgi:hypothetical protein